VLTKHRSLAALAGCCALALTGAPAAGAEEPSKGLKKGYLKIYDRVDDLGGDVGRNIVRHDVETKKGDTRPAKRQEIIRSIGVLRRMEAGLRGWTARAAAPAQATATAAPAPAPATGSTAGAGLQAIAACESGGNPAAVSAGGTYRGKYQFDQQTWQSVGGSGDPAAAPEAEQDRRAAALMAQRGSSPWPTCG
jgi:hypothetical protein